MAIRATSRPYLFCPEEQQRHNRGQRCQYGDSQQRVGKAAMGKARLWIQERLNKYVRIRQQRTCYYKRRRARTPRRCGKAQPIKAPAAL